MAVSSTCFSPIRHGCLKGVRHVAAFECPHHRKFKRADRYNYLVRDKFPKGLQAVPSTPFIQNDPSRVVRLGHFLFRSPSELERAGAWTQNPALRSSHTPRECLGRFGTPLRMTSGQTGLHTGFVVERLTPCLNKTVRDPTDDSGSSHSNLVRR